MISAAAAIDAQSRGGCGWFRFQKIMGKTIANYTDKIEIINSTLFISTNIAPLKNELLYQKTKIIERVNEALGEKVIKEVVIK